MLRELLPLCDQVVFCRIANPRALSPATLASLARQVGGVGADRVHTERDARDGGRARARAGRRDGVVLATGSIYLLADLLRPAGAGRERRCERGRARASCAMVAAVAIIVALVILVFFALGYVFGRMFL